MQTCVSGDGDHVSGRHVRARDMSVLLHTEINSSVCFGASEANVERCVSAFTLLMLGSGVATGGVSKTAGSSSSVENGGGCRVGLGGPQDVVGASGAGWSFTSEFLDAGSRAVGDRARLACRGKREILKPGKYVCLCLGHSVLHNVNINTIELKAVLKSDIM